MEKESYSIIGRVELVELPKVGVSKLPAKVDTGADGSSIWASNIAIVDDSLTFLLLGPDSMYFTGETITVKAGDYHQTTVENSFGHSELRYVVRMSIIVAGRKILARFTLADRSQKLYPVLLGRRLLKNKFLVDVSKGQPLHVMERERRRLCQLGIYTKEREAE